MRYISFFVTVLFVVALVGCTHLPPSDYEQTSEEQNMDEETPKLNFSMFNSADNQIFYKGYRFFSNLPGMVLVMDQEIHSGGVHLSYVHKTNQKEYYFCFDPLCDHCECATGYGGYFIHPWYFAWSAADQNLYALCAKSFTLPHTDGALYRFDMNTQEIETVVSSNGNSIREIYVGNRYILMQRDRATGGCDILRFDPLTGDCVTITPPQGRTLGSVYAAGDVVLVRYVDDPFFYLTNPAFDTYTKTTLTSCEYIAGNTAYSTTESDGAFTSKDSMSHSIYSYNLLTHTVNTLVSYTDMGLSLVGCDGDYIYYGLYSWDAQNPSDRIWKQTKLYRISVNGGEAEYLMDFGANHTNFGTDYAVVQIMRFDGVLYCVLRPVISTGGGDMYGIVAQKNGEWVFERLYAGD